MKGHLHVRPVRDHICVIEPTQLDSITQDWCRVCVAHNLDPANVIPDFSVGAFWKYTAGVVMVSVIISCWLSGCVTLGPQPPTMVHEIHHEACVQQKIVDAGPSDYPKALETAAHDACEREGN